MIWLVLTQVGKPHGHHLVSPTHLPIKGSELASGSYRLYISREILPTHHSRKNAFKTNAKHSVPYAYGECKSKGMAWRGGEVWDSLSCIAVVAWPQTLPSLYCRDGARRVFTDQADIGSTKREAPCGVQRVA